MTSVRPPDSEALRAFWRRACADLDLDPTTSVDWFGFGDSPRLADALASEVVDGMKRATAGLVVEMRADNEPMPAPGQHWIVVDGGGHPRAVIQTREVRVAPFATVDEAFAWDEGEGDRSLSWWRAAHIKEFSRSCERLGAVWSEDLDVVFERFEAVWPPSSARRLVLRRPCIDAEWAAYHWLRRTELFEPFLPHLVYDPDHPDAWTPEVFHFGLFAAGELLGCVQVRWLSASEASIHLVAVDPRRRGAGVGRELVRRAETFAWVYGRRRVRVFSAPSATGFYRSLGYVDGPDWDAVPAAPESLPLTRQLDAASVAERRIALVEHDEKSTPSAASDPSQGR